MWAMESIPAGIKFERMRILPGQILSTAKPIENTRFYRSKATNMNAFILTFILTF